MGNVMWAGRFSKETDDSVNAFNSSISFDSRMYKQDIQGSIAHAKMLGDCGIISKDDSDRIIMGLKGIFEDIESGKLIFDQTAEDIHMFIEAVLTERIGDTGKKLHTARSRNDQTAVDLRLYLREQAADITSELKKLINLLCETAQLHMNTIMPGYTHLQRAQPITLAHHLMAYAQMFLRDADRIKDAVGRMNYSPLGCGALAGTTYPINRKQTSLELGFAAPCANSLDGVADRDFCAELINCAALIMMHLSRFSEEIIMWCSWEFKFIELDDAYATGSSIMPQKKNPDICELIRGKTGRVNGDLISVLTMLKGLPLAYNKDMQEDKEAVFDAVDTVLLCLKTFIPMLKTMRVNKENMRAAAAKGFINATDCADYLVKKGLPFRDAYKITGMLVRFCVENNLTLEELPIDQYKKLSPLFEDSDNDSVYDAINLENCVNQRISQGAPAPQSVAEQIEITQIKLREV